MLSCRAWTAAPSGVKSLISRRRQRDRQPLLLAAGQLPVPGVPLPGQPEKIEQRQAVRRGAVEAGVEVDRLGDGELVGQRALLQLDADLFPQPGAAPLGVHSQHADQSAVGPAQAHGALHGGGLPGAVAAEDPEDLTLFHGEAHIVDGDLLAVPLVDVLNVDRCHVVPPGIL